MAGAALLLGANGFLGDARFGILDGTCSTSTIAEANAALERLGIELGSGNVAAADAAAPGARAAARAVARCVPARPETWLVLARLEGLDGGVTPDLSRLVALSCRAAPTQLWTAEDRLRMFGGISGALESSARACLENDRRLVALAETMRAR